MVTMTNDEVNDLIAHFDRRFDAQDHRLDKIEEHVSKTNGRVSALERWQWFQDGVKAGSGRSWAILMGGAAVVGTIVGTAINIVTAVAR